MARALVGTSGYVYPHWLGIFYPEELSERDWLSYYASHFETVELNNTFYRLPSKTTFHHWAERTPKDFVFAVKGNRFITHIKRLKGCAEPLATFADRLEPLAKKAGVILWQLPPKWRARPERLAEFLQFARRSSLHQAFEFRERSWFSSEIYEILGKAKATIVLADWPYSIAEEKTGLGRVGKGEPINVPVTADFVYLRRHGPAGAYAGSYSDEQLRADAAAINHWLSAGRTVYCYFNNDAHGFAVKNAQRLKELL